MLIATLAIAGVPPFSGFFSKDEILWGAFEQAPALCFVGLVVAFLTAFYTGRLVCMTFFGTCRARDEVKHHIHESPAVMTLPLIVLAVLSLGGGFLPVPATLATVLGEAHEAHAPVWFMGLATALAAGGLGLAWFCYVSRPDVPAAVAARLGGFYALVRDKFRVDEAYDALVVRPVFAAAEISARDVDVAVIDGAVNGAGQLVAATSGVWRRFQTGNVQHYALSFLVGALVLLAYLASR
jgi:NADH-quinone oxidoreductase subunit L